MKSMNEHRLESLPSSRTGENPPYGMIGRIEETSASSKPDPRLDPTRLPLADMSHLAATEMTLGELSWKSKAKRSLLPAHRAAWVPQSPKKWHWQAAASFSCSPATKTS